jgi:hypothetical protein
MKTYIASRISGGNTLFPPSITLSSMGVTLRVPGLFQSSEKTIPFSGISMVDIECPLVGYSNIIIETTGEGRIEVHGFTASEVNEIKNIILSKL